MLQRQSRLTLNRLIVLSRFLGSDAQTIVTPLDGISGTHSSGPTLALSVCKIYNRAVSQLTPSEKHDVDQVAEEDEILQDPRPEALLKPEIADASQSTGRGNSAAELLVEETGERLSEPVDTSTGPVIDVSYRSPTELLWPESKRQRKFGARVGNALELALTVDRAGGRLSSGMGFAVEEVRVEPDFQKAFILWDAFPSAVPDAERELKARMPSIRRSVAKYLKARRVPVLVFCHNKPTEEQAELEETFRRLDAEGKVSIGNR